MATGGAQAVGCMNLELNSSSCFPWSFITRIMIFLDGEHVRGQPNTCDTERSVAVRDSWLEPLGTTAKQIKSNKTAM